MGGELGGTDGAPYELYMFLNSQSATAPPTNKARPARAPPSPRPASRPASPTTTATTPPPPLCSTASSQGASSPVWWLDVENDLCGQYWSCNQTLNSLTIQGALDYLHSLEDHCRDLLDLCAVARDHRRLRAPRPADPDMGCGCLLDLTALPVELRLLPACGAGTVLRREVRLRRRRPWLLQETPGPNNYPFDPDYAC